ncbi:unnamed protein product [Umbelopsis vinacea]
MSNSEDEIVTEQIDSWFTLDAIHSSNLGENVPDDIWESTEANGGYALVGLDTPTPFLQLGTEIYQGEYDETIGSNLLMEKVPRSDLESDTLQDGQFELSFAGSTTKIIQFKRVTLVKREETISSKEAQSKEEEEQDPNFIQWAK